MGVELREKHLPSGNTQLVLDTYYPGRRGPGGKRGRQVIRATGCILNGDKKHDKEQLLKAEAMLAQARVDFGGSNGEQTPASFRDASFIEYMDNLGKTKDAANTQKSWKQSLEHFGAFMEGREPTFGELSRELFDGDKGFKAYLLKELDSPNSAQIYLKTVKAALNQALKDGKISSNPCRDVKIKGKKSPREHLTPKQVQKLADSPCRNLQVKNSFLFQCYSGLRISDVVALKWQDIDGDQISFTQKKTGDLQNLPLSKRALAILEQQRAISPGPNVFQLPCVQSIDGYLERWGKAAGLETRLHSHLGRHTFAVDALEKGVDLYSVSKLLGHRNIQTTQIYGQITDKKLRSAVQMLDRP